jgi:hypothetical protein
VASRKTCALKLSVCLGICCGFCTTRHRIRFNHWDQATYIKIVLCRLLESDCWTYCWVRSRYIYRCSWMNGLTKTNNNQQA